MTDLTPFFNLPPQLFAAESVGLHEHLRQMILAELQAPRHASQLTSNQIRTLLDRLPRLTEAQIKALGDNDCCPICLTSFLALLAEEEMALAMDSPAHSAENLGVTRLSEPWQCGHVFCRKDISTWIRDGHDSCPLCRQPLVRPDNGALPSASDAQPANSSETVPVVSSATSTLLSGGGSASTDGTNASTSREDASTSTDSQTQSGPFGFTGAHDDFRFSVAADGTPEGFDGADLLRFLQRQFFGGTEGSSGRQGEEDEDRREFAAPRL